VERFDPRIRAWFARRYGAPTPIQALAWPRIASGDDVLATAPTGSGKTLAAFLWAIDRLATGAWEPAAVRVLYVSPLKALNTDVRKNLLEPLAELRDAFGAEWTPPAIAVRSGDTPARERQRMLRRPPEILVTTPESLNLLLSSPRGRTLLPGVRTVILDEIHAVAGSKRGTYLVTAVERVAQLAGGVQRVALSATVEPRETIARFVGGFDDSGEARPVAVVASDEEKRGAISVHVVDAGDGPSSWSALTAALREIGARTRSTLFFVNNRALAERLARMLTVGAAEPVAYAHHGSLARELRALVETRLKEGRLRAIVATSSLELGIDVGSVDEVVLVQSPRTATSAVQRVGRAGHRVGATSRGCIYPTHGRDVLDAAALAPLIEARTTEAIRPVRAPLDVLAQVLVSMCAVDSRDLDDAYALLRRTWPYRELKREAFGRVVAMLRGRYEETRLRELRPRLRVEPATGRARAADGVLPVLWRSRGVIPDRGYFTVRLKDSGARNGELDEEF
jgi:ATP-dependent Lhr-like helicase